MFLRLSTYLDKITRQGIHNHFIICSVMASFAIIWTMKDALFLWTQMNVHTFHTDCPIFVKCGTRHLQYAAYTAVYLEAA